MAVKEFLKHQEINLDMDLDDLDGHSAADGDLSPLAVVENLDIKKVDKTEHHKRAEDKEINCEEPQQ